MTPTKEYLSQWRKCLNTERYFLYGDCSHMDLKVGDVLIGNHCNWKVECLLGCGTCSRVFEAKSAADLVEDVDLEGAKSCDTDRAGWNKNHGILTAAVKVFKEGKNYESSAWNEVHIQNELIKDIDAFSAECIFVPLMGHFHHHKHMCLVYEKLSYNLHHILLRNSSEGLPLIILQKCSEHLFRTLEHLARKGIVHGDIKPSNIMWNANKAVFQLVDYGLAFYEGRQSEQPVHSLGYESPEAQTWNKMIKEKSMSKMTPSVCCCASDMWSMACVLVHLYTGLTLSPGKQKSYHSTCDHCTQECGDCNYSAHLDQTLVLPQDSRLITEEQHQRFKDLIIRMMKCKPADRISPQEALNHQFFTDTSLYPGLSLSELLLLPTRFLLLVNMYGDVSELGDTEEHQDFLSDVEDECAKYGEVRKVSIPLDGSKQCEGKVCVEYEFAESCEKAANALMGRTFNGRTVIASFCPRYLDLKCS